MLEQLIQQSEVFKGFLANTSTKKSEFRTVFEEISESLEDLTVNFLSNCPLNSRRHH